MTLLERDAEITNLIAQIRAARTMAMRDSLFDQLIEVWETPPVQKEPVAWKSKTCAYVQYVTQSRYELFSVEAKRWYEPYTCADCMQASVPSKMEISA